MSGPRYDRILASTALALILAAPLGAAAVAQEAAAPTTAESAAQRAAAKYANAALDAAITPQPKNELPAQAPELAGASSVVVSPAPAPAPGETSAVPKDVAAPAAAPSEPPAAAKDAAAPATPASSTIATEQTVAPDPMASLDPADRVVAEKIRDLLAAKSDKIFASKKERAAVETFYQARSFAPLWLEKGVENARSKAVVARLKGAEADGLEVNDYKTPNFAGTSPDALADADLKLTQTVLTYARHVQAGRFPYTRVSNNMELIAGAAGGRRGAGKSRRCRRRRQGAR